MTTIENTAVVTEPKEPATHHLFGSVIDFLGLGGVSLFLLPVLLILPTDALQREVGIMALVLANFINHPHFAVSYTLFYEGFRGKITDGPESSELANSMRWRYRFAGIVVPIALFAGAVAAIADGDGHVMGHAISAMAFFVGWHYVKQGYGMAMLDAALKRAYFDDISRRTLRANGYLVWLVSWAVGTRLLDDSQVFGFPIRPVALPNFVVGALVASLIVTSLVTATLLLRRLVTSRPTGWTGVMAYLVSLYVWLLLVRFEPLFLLLTPVLHSLQYLLVVARFEENRSRADRRRPPVRTTYLRATALGFALFWAIPILFESLDAMRGAADDGRMSFLAAAWILVNIHHYFIDNVIWRKENAEVGRHLFGTTA